MNIGDEISFVRYGRIPANGMSTNWATGEKEAGVSVYTEDCTVRGEFEERETVIRGIGTVIGFGSDDEPLIDARTIWSDDYAPEEELYIDGYQWDGIIQ